MSWTLFVFILRGNQAKQQGIIGKYDMEDAVIQTNDRQMRAPIRVRMKDETKNTKYLTEKDYIFQLYTHKSKKDVIKNKFRY